MGCLAFRAMLVCAWIQMGPRTLSCEVITRKSENGTANKKSDKERDRDRERDCVCVCVSDFRAIVG